MITNNFYKILASALMTNSKQPFKATAASGSGSDYFYGYPSQVGSRIVFPSIMSTVNKTEIVYGQSYGQGVFFGDGTTPPTADDYKLSGNVVGNFTHTVVSVTNTTDENGVSITALYNITNTDSNPITISEIGLFFIWGRTSTQDTYAYLVDRTLLESPVTIEPNGIGQITYTVRLNIPTT